MEVKTNITNICIGVGNVVIDGRIVGAVNGDIVLSETRTTKKIDDISQYPGVTLQERILGKKWFLRINLYEASLENLQLALGGKLTVSGDAAKLTGGTGGEFFAREHTIEIYGQGGGLKRRKFYAYRAIVSEIGEINLFSNEGTKIPITFELLRVPGLPEDENVWYITDEENE